MITYEQVTLFTLVLVRVTTFLAVAQIFNFTGVPRLVRVGLAFLLVTLILPFIPATGSSGENLGVFITGVMSEVLVGLAMGLVVNMLLSSFTTAGQIIDVHMGLLVASILDPLSGGLSTILARALHFLALVLLLTMDGHHMILAAMVKSFQVVPPGGGSMSGSAALLTIRTFAAMIVLAVQITIPVVAAALLVDLCLGLVGRTAPQLNIFLMGFPLKIAFGLLTLAALAPLLGLMMRSVLTAMESDLTVLLKALMH